MLYTIIFYPELKYSKDINSQFKERIFHTKHTLPTFSPAALPTFANFRPLSLVKVTKMLDGRRDSKTLTALVSPTKWFLNMGRVTPGEHN
jgi:hypothetical protein